MAYLTACGQKPCEPEADTYYKARKLLPLGGVGISGSAETAREGA